MRENNNRYGLIADLLDQFVLAWKLFWDARVPASIKVLAPAIALGYLIFPIDIIPDFLPVLGQLDDLAVVFLLVRLLIMLAPQEIVAQHQGRAWPGEAENPEAPQNKSSTNTTRVVDGTYRVKKS